MVQWYDYSARLLTTLSVIAQNAPPDAITTTAVRDPANQFTTAQTASLQSSSTALRVGLRLYNWCPRQAFGPGNVRGNTYSDLMYVVTDAIGKPRMRSAGTQALDGRFGPGPITFAGGQQQLTVSSSRAETVVSTFTGFDGAGNALTVTLNGTGSTSVLTQFAIVTGWSLSGASNGIMRCGGSLGQRLFLLSPAKADAALYANIAWLTNQSHASYLTGDGPVVSLPGSSATVTLGANPFTTIKGDSEVVTAQVGHGYVEGQFVNMSGAAAVNGLPTSVLGAVQVDRVPDANSWTFLSSVMPTASGSGGGTGIKASAGTGSIALLGFQPFTPTYDGITPSAVCTVWEPGHSRRVGNTPTIVGSSAVGGIVSSKINGVRTVLAVVDADHWTFTAGGNFLSVNKGGSNAIIASSNPIITSSGSSVIGVRWNAHGGRVGETVTLAGFSDTGGIPGSAINRTLAIVGTPSNDWLQVDTGTVASSSVSGGGAGTAQLHFSLQTAQNQSWRAAIVTGITVDRATAGHITVGGIYDGADYICASQMPTGAGNLVLNPAHVAGGTITLSQAQELTITSDADDRAAVFTVSIVNNLGVAATFVLPSPNATTVQAADNQLSALMAINDVRPFTDLVIFGAARLPAWVLHLDFDYERSASVTTGQTKATFDTLTSICHSAPIPRYCHPYLDGLDAPSQATNGISQRNIPYLATHTDGLSFVISNSGAEGDYRSAFRTALYYLRSLTPEQLAKQTPVIGFGPVDYTSIAGWQTHASAGNLTINNAGNPIPPPAPGSAQPSSRSVALFSTDDCSDVTFTINGVDTMQGPTAGGYAISPVSYTVFPTSISTSTGCPGKISAGFSLGIDYIGARLQDIVNVRAEIEQTPIRQVMIWGDFATFGTAGAYDEANLKLQALTLGTAPTNVGMLPI